MFFVNAKKGTNIWWMYLLGVLSFLGGYLLIGAIPLQVALFMALGKNPELGLQDIENFQKNPDFSVFNIGSNFGLVLMLLIFVGALLMLLLAVKYIHKRNLLSLINPNSTIRWSRIFFGFGLWLFMTLILEGFNYWYNPEGYIISTINWSSLLPLILISIFLLPIQTSAEEILFRGYLMPGLGMWWKNKWAPLIVTSVLFGLIHSMNPEVEEFGFLNMQFYYVSAGLMLGIITIMDDGLELALGVHWATNLYGAVFMGYNGAAIQTDSLMKTDDVNTTLMTAVFIVSSIIFIFICSKKFNWQSLTTIFEPLDDEVHTLYTEELHADD